jgi:dipeptidyl aminopeptidase/acylaminoacyl peptidase
MKKSAPYGSWESPVTTQFVAGKDRSLSGGIHFDGEDLYFIEARPDEGGRQVLMRRTEAGRVEAVVPDDFNLLTRYLEYGGLASLVRNGEIFFVHFADQQIYRSRLGERPQALTAEPSSRFAHFTLDEKRNRLIALRERTAQPEPINSVCAIDLGSGKVEDLVTGADFYLSSQLNPRGDKIVWISWNHPNMAWNGTELWLADVDSDGSVKNPQKIAGDSSHGICQPQWLGNDDLLFAGELEEWFNLYVYRRGSTSTLLPMEAEFAFPDWVPGQKNYGVSGDTICASFVREGSMGLALIQEGKAKILPHAFASIYGVEPGKDGFYALAGFSRRPPALIHIDLKGEWKELYSSYDLKLPAEAISEAQAVRFPTEDGSVGHAWFYPPLNENFTAPDGEKPPLIVMCHGGPTAMSTGDFRKSTQFWTSRGYAVVDVNYGGSTGYGRRYRERLRGQWGKVDVSDCVAVVNQLAKEGAIDPRRVAIRGGSAGGYTTLAALAFTKGVISVGASYYGVSGLELLAKETHKLESRYLDQLVGPYPEALSLYKERSPLEHVAQLNCPIIFFQGEEDRVVPPNQSQLMHESLQKKGIYSEYHLYPGEGHGFRRAETIQHSLKAEHAFYARAFGFAVSASDRLA